MKRFIAATFALIGLSLTISAFAATPESATQDADREIVREGDIVNVIVPAGHGVSTEIVITPQKCPEGQQFVCRFNNNGSGSCGCEPELEEK